MPPQDPRRAEAELRAALLPASSGLCHTPSTQDNMCGSLGILPGEGVPLCQQLLWFGLDRTQAGRKGGVFTRMEMAGSVGG